MTDSIAIVAGLIKYARPPILEHFSANSCIASTRIGIDVLDYFGIKSVPIPLLVAIFNQEAVKILDAGGTLAEMYEATAQYTRTDVGGPWTLAVGAEIENSTDWAGHLVIGIPHIHGILDLSIDQATRAHKGLVFDEPLLVRVDDPDWWSGESPRWASIMQGKDGVRVGFVFDRDPPDPNGYRRSKNWHRTSTKRPADTKRVFKEITGKIIRQIKEDL